MAGPEGSEALDAALDELYGVDPSEFVVRRKALAADLRTAGDKQGAKAILAARRPTTVAWALNQVARTEPDLVAELLERSRELEAAQMGAGPGGREGVREVTQAHRDALGAATAAALGILGDRATDAYRTQLQATLRAAGAEPELAEMLRDGRFVKELTGPSGFPEGFTLTLVPDLDPAEESAAPADSGPKSARRPKIRSAHPTAPVAREESDRETSAAKAQSDAARARADREAAAAAKEERRRAEAAAAWQAALETADAAATEARDADRRVEELETELEGARREARGAAERAAAARREAGKLERAATGKPKPKIHRA
jgi:hypothetical protein